MTYRLALAVVLLAGCVGSAVGKPVVEYLPVTVPAMAPCPPDWQARSVGRYEGMVGDSGIVGVDGRVRYSVTTTFTADSRGNLQGRYVRNEGNRAISGILTMLAADPCRPKFRWQEGEREGFAVLMFYGPAFFGTYGLAGEDANVSGKIWGGNRAKGE